MSAPTAFVIAGPARCGKSTLAHKLARRIDAQWVSVDALSKALRDTGMNDIVGLSVPIEGATVEGWLDAIRIRDRETSRFLIPFIENVIGMHHSSVIIDNSMWAEGIAALSIPVRTAFLVDTGIDSADRLRAIRDSGEDSPNNLHYHRNYDDSMIDEWANFNRERSRLFAYHASVYGYPLFDLAEYHSFDEMQNAALVALLDGYDGSISL